MNAFDLDVKKLPVWAQREMTRLKFRVEKLEADLAVATGEYAETAGVYQINSGGNVLPLPAKAIRFRLGPGPRDFIEARLSEGFLNLNGHRSILVQPHATNVANILMGDL